MGCKQDNCTEGHLVLCEGRNSQIEASTVSEDVMQTIKEIPRIKEIYGNVYRKVSNKTKLKDGIAVVQDGRLCTHILRQHDSIICFFRGLSETCDFPPLLSPLLSTLCCKVAKFRTRQQDNMFLFINFTFSKKNLDNYHLQNFRILK